MIRLREFTQAEAEIFVHPEKKNHPNFERYAEKKVPLRGIKQQECGEEPLEITMKEAVSSGIVANEYVAYYVALTHDFLVTCGADPKKVRFRQHLPDERAHYATDCWDAEILSGRFGWVETVGIADRTSYDLKAHSKQSGDSFTVFIPYDEPKKGWEKRIVPDMGALGPKYRGKAKAVADALSVSKPTENGAEIEIDGERILIPPELYEVREQETEIRGEDVMPHVIEPSYGIDRILYSILEHSYEEEEVEGEIRRVLHFPPRVAPVQAAVLPLMGRDGLDTIALEIMEEIQNEGLIAQYDDSGAIGRRYRRQDEIGTPFAITVDYDTKEDKTVTLRDRDSMKQIRCDANKVPGILRDLIRGRISFEDLE
jgi:glycyl-tRNA synthetase